MVSLVCGSAEFSLVALPVADYPALPEPPPAAGTIEGCALAIAASQVAPAARTKAANNIRCCVARCRITLRL